MHRGEAGTSTGTIPVMGRKATRVMTSPFGPEEMAAHIRRVTDLIKMSGEKGISEALLIQQLRGSGIRNATLHRIIRDAPDLTTTTEMVKREGHPPQAITVYRYVLHGAESTTEASGESGRVIGSIHADRATQEPSAADEHPIYEKAREALEHRAPEPSGPAPIPQVVFRGSGYNNPTDMAGWFDVPDRTEDWLWR